MTAVPDRLAAFLRRALPLALLMPLLLSLGGCATRPADPVAAREFDERNDKLEPLNRTLFHVDQGLDAVVIRPVAWTYRKVAPDPLKRGVTHALSNLRSPVTMVNDLLQGQVTDAGITLWRLIINSIFGIGGLFDVADSMGVKGHTNDFGLTLASWGVSEGSFLYLPVIGPSSIRDGVGLGVDAFGFDPVSWYSYNPHNIQWIQWVNLAAEIVDAKANTMAATDELKRSSIDYYAALRSAYRQYRAKAARHGKPAAMAPLPSYDEDGDPFAAEKPQSPR